MNVGPEPVEGYRCFNAARAGDRFDLRSYNEGFPPFVKGPNEALCFSIDMGGFSGMGSTALKNRRDNDEGVEIYHAPPAHGRIPDPTCGCGFWIYANLLAFRAKLKHFGISKGFRIPRSFKPSKQANAYGDFATEAPATLKIPGMMRGWGRTLKGKDGWRTEFAEVSALCAWSDRSAEVLRPWAEAYDVPVVLEPSLGDTAPIPLKAGQVEGYLEARGPDPGMSAGGRPLPREWQINGEVYVAWDDSVIGSKLALLWEVEVSEGKPQKIRVLSKKDPRYGNKVITSATPAPAEQ